MPPDDERKKPNADQTWGNMNQAVRNDVPRALLKAKKSILHMRRMRSRW